MSNPYLPESEARRRYKEIQKRNRQNAGSSSESFSFSLKDTLRYGLTTPGAAWVLLYNLWPLLGVLAFGWDATTVVFLYFCHSVVMGFVNVLKMMSVQNDREVDNIPKTTGLAGFGFRVFMSGFFFVHFNGFNLIQMAFFFILMVDVRWYEFVNERLADPAFVAGLGMFAATLLREYWTDFIKNGLYRKANVGLIMFEPYSRIFVQQLVVIFGTILFLAFDESRLGVIIYVSLLIFLRSLVDLTLHRMRYLKSTERPELDAPEIPAGL